MTLIIAPTDSRRAVNIRFTRTCKSKGEEKRRDGRKTYEEEEESGRYRQF